MNTSSPPCPEAWQNVWLTDCIIAMKANDGDRTPSQLVTTLAAHHIHMAEELWNCSFEQLRTMRGMTEELVNLAIRLKDCMIKMDPPPPRM